MSAGKSGLIAGGNIDGARMTGLEPRCDPRGDFTEIFKDRWQLCIKPVQWSLVRSAAGVVRGMHLHRRHDEYFLVVSGRVSLGLRDLRPDARTAGKWSLYGLTGADPACVSFPRGVLHGMYAHEPTVHLQAVSEDFETYGGDDNHGCRWDDPDLEIPWPQSEAIVSPRAASFPSLRELIAVIARQAGR